MGSVCGFTSHHFYWERKAWNNSIKDEASWGLADSQCFAAGPVSTAAGMASGVVTLSFHSYNRRENLSAFTFHPIQKQQEGNKLA